MNLCCFLGKPKASLKYKHMKDGDHGDRESHSPQDGLALRHASNELKNDWVFVASAVCRDGEALQFASNELRNDGKMVTGTL